MASQANIDLAQQMYVAYYGRPADPTGLAYWAGRFETTDNLDHALASFGDSAEYVAGFGALSNVALVTNLYQQMFGRTPEAEGLAFYVDKISTGASTLATVAWDIAVGSQNDDLIIITNRIDVANTYTTAITTNGADYTSAEIADAQVILSAVDATAASVTAGETAAEDEVVANIPVEATPTTTTPTTTTTTTTTSSTPSSAPSEFIVTETDGAVTFSGNVSGDISLAWAGTVAASGAQFTQASIVPSTTPDFAGTATSIALASGEVLSASAANLTGVTATGAGTVAVTALEGAVTADLSGLTTTRLPRTLLPPRISPALTSAL